MFLWNTSSTSTVFRVSLSARFSMLSLIDMNFFNRLSEYFIIFYLYYKTYIIISNNRKSKIKRKTKKHLSKFAKFEIVTII